MEDIGGADAGRAILARWWRGDSDVEAQRALELLIAGQRVIVAPAGFVVAGDQIKNVLVPPDGRVGLGDIEIGKADLPVGRDIEL